MRGWSYLNRIKNKRMQNMDKYIKLLADASKTQGHELIEECLACYGVIGIRELTRQQIKDFCRIKCLLQNNNIIAEHN